MSQQLDNAFGTYTTYEAIERFSGVKLSSTTDKTVAKAGAGEASIGVTQAYAASGATVVVKHWNGGGTFLCRAGAAITSRNSTVYAGADGTVKNTATGPKVGYALDTASAAESIVEVLPTASLSPGSATIDDNTGGTTGGTLTLVALYAKTLAEGTLGGTTGGTSLMTALFSKALAEGTLGGTTGGTMLLAKVRGTGYSAGLITDVSNNLQVLRARIVELEASIANNLQVIRAAIVERDPNLAKNLRVLAKAQETAGIASVI